MNSYQYIAKDRSGHSVTGVIDGATEVEAAAYLHQKELIVISIKQAKSKKKVGERAKGGKIRGDDLVIFSRQLATMIDAGIPLVQALGVLSDQIENAALKAVVTGVRQDIEGGTSFCDALAKYPNVFNELFINMARAGESSGMLDEVLDRLAFYIEKSSALAAKVRSSLIYPAVVVTMAMLITIFLLVKVVPTFKSIFDSLGGELPTPTLILITISNILRKFFPIVFVSLFVGAILLKRYISTEGGRYQFDTLKLKLPIVGPLFCKVAVAKFTRTFATLVKSGVAVLNALDIVAKSSGNKIVEETINSCRTSVREGEPIARPLSKSKVFPPMVCRMIGIGEQTGQLEKMLTKIADFYDEQVDTAVEGLTSLIEPLVISFLGIVVGGIVVSLFLPIFKLTELVGK